jgi:hypothetical protein
MPRYRTSCGLSLNSRHESFVPNSTTYQNCQLLLVRGAERPERFPLSATVWRRTPPPLRLGVGDVTLSSLRSIADFYCGVAAIWDRLFIIWKGASPPPLTPEVSVTRTSFPLPPACHIAPGGMDLARGSDVVLVRLRPRYIAAQRETSPWRPAADVISPFSLTLTYLSSSSCLGDTGAFGPGF